MNDPASNHRRFDAVMFDMDGTLVDSRGAIVASYHDATREILGEPFPVAEEDINQIIQMRGQESFPLIAGGDMEIAERLRIEFGKAYKVHQEEAGLYPLAEEALTSLHSAGVPLGIATSKARERLEQDLGRTGIRECFAVTVTGDDVPRAKPDPAPITAGIEALGIEPGRLLYVGDGPNDIIAAKAAGAAAAGVSFGFHPDECRAESPDWMIDSYSELPPLVLG